MSRSTEEKGDIRCDSDFSRIEELIEGNSFSREEISRLVEILNSRVDNGKEKQKLSNAEGDAPLFSWTNEIQRTPLQEKHQDIDGIMTGTFHRNSDVSLGVGASPIDIAREYMASRTSEGGLDRDNLVSKCERPQLINEFTQKQLLPSPCPKPSICWPGAMVHDPHGYATPQSQRRHRLHDFPRTPYSRTTLPKSTTKVQLQAENGNPHTSTPLQPSRMPFYDRVTLRGDTKVGGYGSVGPIRRIRNKFASEVRPRGSVFPSLSTDTLSTKVTPKNFGGFLPSTEKNLEPGETSGASKHWSVDNVPSPSDRGVLSPHLSSNQAVRKILEHLDRNKPTPKEKEAELKLVTSWRRSSETSDAIHTENNINSVHIGELASHKNTDGEINKSSRFKFSANYLDRGMNEAKDAINGNGMDSNSVSTGFKILPGENLLPSPAHMGTSGPAIKSVNKSTFVADATHGQNHRYLHFPHTQPSDGLDSKTAAGPTSSVLSKDNPIKPSLPSISIKKPDFRRAPHDNFPGFTFPVSASSGVLSELPTPSIMPPPSASFLPSTSTELPVYSFDTNKATPHLVFSFSSTSSAADKDDSDLKFNFGSDKKTTRLSFSSFGKDAICY